MIEKKQKETYISFVVFTDGLEENVLDKSDNISLDPSNSTSPKKPSTPVSRQSANQSFVDESLHDEDAWMSILAVVNAEVRWFIFYKSSFDLTFFFGF